MSEKRKYHNVIKEIPATAVDIYRMLPEGTRCEVIFNELTMSPSPTPQHQLLLSDLHALLYFFLKEAKTGKVIPSPIDVYLENNSSVVQPDLVVILDKNLDRIREDGIYGPPDIVIEILSRNRAYDTQMKKALYEQAGVREYFMIEPQNKKTILLIPDATGAYIQSYEETGVLHSEILGFNIKF